MPGYKNNPLPYARLAVGESFLLPEMYTETTSISGIKWWWERKLGHKFAHATITADDQKRVQVTRTA